MLAFIISLQDITIDMLSRIIDENKIKTLRQILEHNDNIVITCHISPDGDAIGSSLGLAHVLSDIGKNVKVITPDMPPKNLMFLPGAKDIVVYTKYEEFATRLIDKADVIFALDYNDLKRVDRLGQYIEQSRGEKVMIDHHLFPGNFARVVISNPEVSSTSMLIFRVLCRLELYPLISREAAMCIYTGMMTDTGNFSYNSNDPDLYIVISELLKKGVDKDMIYSRVFNSNTESRLRLNGYAIDQKMKIFPEHRAALISLSRAELNQYHYQKGDTESLVNVPLSIPDIVYSFFIREESDYIKVSARSKGDFAVNEICERCFNGGGHKNAAGGEFYGTLSECEQMFLSTLDENDKKLPKHI